MRVRIAKLAFIVLVVSAQTSCGSEPAPTAGEELPPPGTPITEPRSRARPYFVGHSLVNHDMPEMLQDIARGLGGDHAYDCQVKNGTPLRVQWEEEAPGEGRAADGEEGRPAGGGFLPGQVKVALPSGNFDVLVITEAPPIATQVQWVCSAAYALELYNLAVSSNAGTQVYYYEAWSRTDMTDDWRGQITRDRPLIDRYIVDAVNDPVSPPARPAGAGNCPHPSPPRERADGKPMLVVPAGRAMRMLDEAIEAGTIPGISTRAAIFSDHIHLTDLGNYFVALVMYATIYAKDPAGAPRETTGEWQKMYAAPPPETAARLQELAWQAVLADPRSGVRETR